MIRGSSVKADELRKLVTSERASKWVRRWMFWLSRQAGRRV